MEASFQNRFCIFTAKLVTRNFWCRYALGTHPFPSRTRWLRPGRPMVLCWRRYGRAGGRRNLWGCSSVGRAPALQAGGQEFESLHLHLVPDDGALRTLKTAYSFKYPIDRKICQQDIREKTTFKQFKSKTYMQRYAWYVGEAKKSAGWMPWH